MSHVSDTGNCVCINREEHRGCLRIFCQLLVMLGLEPEGSGLPRRRGQVCFPRRRFHFLMSPPAKRERCRKCGSLFSLAIVLVGLHTRSTGSRSPPARAYLSNPPSPCPIFLFSHSSRLPTQQPDSPWKRNQVMDTPSPSKALGP